MMVARTGTRSPAAPGHLPVMLAEVLQTLAPADGDVIADATFGGGGYTRAILKAANCSVIGIDRDLDAIVRAEALAAEFPRLVPLLGRFGDMDTLLAQAGHPKVDSVVLDIGVSSFQIDEAERGFSFMKDGPLDMRMGAAGPSAADVVNKMAERDLANIIFRLGEERNARRIARSIAERRGSQPFETTADLAALVEVAVGGRRGARTHPATHTFQAIRMYVNDELGELARGLRAAEEVLKPGGRLVVVTFHSLEDRLVKQWLRERTGGVPAGSRHVPLLAKPRPPSFEQITNKALQPSEKEVETNPRARSARLRAAVRTEAAAFASPADDGMDLPPITELEASP
jgi:16S rRNA (cytosine1402-N4)-methyltransferase